MLCQAGLDVVVLEKGAYHTEQDFAKFGELDGDKVIVLRARLGRKRERTRERGRFSRIKLNKYTSPGPLRAQRLHGLGGAEHLAARGLLRRRGHDPQLVRLLPDAQARAQGLGRDARAEAVRL